MREAQSFNADFSICPLPPPLRAAPTAKPRRTPKVNRLLRTLKLNSTDFSQIPKIICPRFRCLTSFTSPGHIRIWDFYFDISKWRIHSIRAWTPALLLRLINPCIKRKVVILTKLKCKIYKTKSLGYYITNEFIWQKLYIFCCIVHVGLFNISL